MNHRFLALAVAIYPVTCLHCEQLLPTNQGTTWNYEMTQDNPSSEISLDQKSLDQDKPSEHFAVSYRIAGTQTIDNIDFVKLEMYRGDVRASTDFIREEERGIVCAARMDGSGAMLRFVPPQTMVATPLKRGTKWRFDGKIGGKKVTQNYEITGEEDIDLVAGKFRAWRIHCDQSAPAKAAIDRWFVPGTGFIKVRTQVKARSGGVLQETVLELKEQPKIVAQPEATSNPSPTPISSLTPSPSPTPTPSTPTLTVGLSKTRRGDFTTAFNTTASAIYARWEGHDLRPKAKIRAVFIADNVADLAADYEIDDAEATARSPNSGGMFTLSKPDGDWTPGDYRVDFFIDDQPAGSVKLKISK